MARQMQQETIRRRTGVFAQMIVDVAGNVPAKAIPWIQEAAESDTDDGMQGQSFLSRLFVGSLPPGLTKDQGERLRRQALITAGLQILASDRTGIEAIATGILFARRGATESIGALVDEQKRQEAALRFRSALNDSQYPTELARYQEARRRALKDGDLEAVKVINDVIKELKDLPVDADQRVFRIVGGDAFWVNETENKVYDLSGREITAELLDAQQAAQVQAGRTFTKEVRGQDGLLHSVLFDGRTGQPIQDLGISEVVKTEKRGSSRVDEATANTLDRELAILDEVFSARGYRPFNRAENNLPREAQSTPQQRADAAAKNVVSLIIRARSGAQASEMEAKRLESFSVPLPGNTPEVVREKLARLRAMADDLRGGSLSVPSGSVDLSAAEAILRGAK